MKTETIPGTKETIHGSTLLKLTNTELAFRCSGSTNLVIQELVRRLEGESGPGTTNRRPFNYVRG